MTNVVSFPFQTPGSVSPPRRGTAKQKLPAPSPQPSKLTAVIGFDELLNLLRCAADGVRARYPEDAREFTRRADEIAEALWQEEEASFLPGGDA